MHQNHVRVFIIVIYCTLISFLSPSDNENQLNIQCSQLVQITNKETSKRGERNKRQSSM